jgi:hypothetical protein
LVTDIACLLLTAKHPDTHIRADAVHARRKPLMVWRAFRDTGCRAAGRRFVLVAIAVVAVALHAQATAIRAARRAETARTNCRRRLGLLSGHRLPIVEGGAALNWGDITAQHSGRPLFSANSLSASAWPFDRGDLR